ncbi:helix-turn-helix domain-containing protein [Streptomyces sp. NPDC051776]|uniref:GlxA family transcriptional regulator n=1 Tax=Streptomyces sp. NPDC051776 TaxID=3155414 RepID=UPI003417D30F
MSQTMNLRSGSSQPSQGKDGHRVAVLALPGVILFELAIPNCLLGAARDACREPLYQVMTCTVEPGAVRTDSDHPILVQHGPEALATADTVIVPATEELGTAYTEGRLTPPLTAAFDRIAPDARVVSICTGAYLLAAAGLLDGRPATTHWSQIDHFKQLFPKVDVQPDVLYTDDGDVLTSAGKAAGIDLCLHLLRRDHGATLANTVARGAVVPPHRDGGQAQYIKRPVPEPRFTSTLPARAWALEHLGRPLTLRDLAQQASMSVRTFTRRFRAETGASPTEWLLHQRIERARHLLETSSLSVDDVACTAGFGTSSSLRKHMRAALGVSPTAYRRVFRTPDLPSTEA